jgi:hypothetical protein
MPKFNINTLRSGKTSQSTVSGRRQVRNLSYLTSDIRDGIKNFGLAQATLIGQTLLEDSRPDLYWSGRLQASGFLFVNGKFIEESGGEINRGSSRKHGSGGYGPIRPDRPHLIVTGKNNQFQIDVIWHTPKHVKKGRVFYMWRGSKWFDYALYKLEKTRFLSIYTESMKNVRKRVKQLADQAFYEALR